MLINFVSNPLKNFTVLVSNGDEMRYNSRLLEPDWVVELGKCYHISETRKRGEAKTAADSFIESFDGNIGYFKEGKKERKYMEKLRIEAMSYGDGKTSRLQEYKDIRNEIKGEMEKRKKRLTRGPVSYITRVIKGGGSMVATYFLLPPLMNLFGVDVDEEAKGSISTGLAIFTGIGVDAINQYYVNKKADKIEEKYKNELKDESKDYRSMMSKESEAALQRARTAWMESFGEPPEQSVDIKALFEASN